MNHFFWAHEIAALLGLNPYETQKNLIYKKKSKINQDSPSLSPIMGNLPPLQSISGNQISDEIVTIDQLKSYIIHKYSDKMNHKILKDRQVTQQHKTYDNLYATVDGICISNNGEKKLIKMNYKKKYKYNDISSKKLATHQLIELLVIMECFDVDSIDYVRYRYDFVDVLTIKRNKKWFQKGNVANIINNLSFSLS